MILDIFGGGRGFYLGKHCLMVRNSTKFVSYKDLKKVCADLKAVYSAPTEESGLSALEEFKKKWDGKYPMISQSWERHWDDLSEFYKYPSEQFLKTFIFYIG